MRGRNLIGCGKIPIGFTNSAVPQFGNSAVKFKGPQAVTLVTACSPCLPGSVVGEAIIAAGYTAHK